MFRTWYPGGADVGISPQSAAVGLAVGSVLRAAGAGSAELNESFAAMENHAANSTHHGLACEASPADPELFQGGIRPRSLLAAARAAESVTPLAIGGMPVGMFSDSEYSCATVHVNPGDALLLYSDGAYEMSGLDGKTCSVADFATLCGHIAAAPGWTLDTLIDDLRRRNQSAAFEDDLSLVVLLQWRLNHLRGRPPAHPGRSGRPARGGTACRRTGAPTGASRSVASSSTDRGGLAR